MTGPVRWKSEANVNTLGTPDQGAPRGAQQTQPSDEELAQIAENLKKEAADKEKDKKPEGSDGSKPKGAGGGDDESSDDSDGAGLDDGLSDDDGDGESDDSSETDDASDDDSGDEDADSEEDEGDSDESEESEEEGTEDSEGEGETDSDDDDSEEGEGDSEEDEGDSEDGEGDSEEGDDEVGDDEEATAGTVGQKRIFRGEASSYAAMHILSAFPGCGKSHLFATPNKLLISDSDSSQFDKAEFPHNYVDHIQEKHRVNDLCLVSSHAEVRAEMKQRNLRYTLVYPARSCKAEYLARYARRGSPASFIEMMERQWDDFLDSCEADDAPSIVLQPGQYLSDVIGRLDD